MMTQLSWKTQFNVLVIKVVALSPGNKGRSGDFQNHKPHFTGNFC